VSTSPPTRLPLLAPHDDALQRCVYCPKLCRAACPVSEAEGRESTTPWGKMSTSWFMGRGDVPIDESHASLAWACTGCRACKTRCDHGNEVATVLGDARADLFARGVAPEAAREVARTFDAHDAATADAARALARSRGPAAEAATKVLVLVGCGYLRHHEDVARDALAAAEALVSAKDGRPARAAPIEACCGQPLLHAGDREGFARAARRFAALTRGAERLVAVDPGCARTLLVEYARVGVDVPPPELFVDLAADPSAPLAATGAGGAAPRWHDPCQMGRGLGRYDEPRRALARVAGVDPQEFPRRREGADCSGGGALLPETRPATAAAIASARVGDHRRLGGGTLVTGCAESLRRFRLAGERAEDLATWVARGLGVAHDPGER
jgi:Fe-S oxidoreductase